MKNKVFLGFLIMLVVICVASEVIPSIAELYRHEDKYGKFIPTGNMTEGRSGHKSVLLNDGRVFLFGGTSNDSLSPEFYNPQTGKFTLVKNSFLAKKFFTRVNLPV